MRKTKERKEELDEKESKRFKTLFVEKERRMKNIRKCIFLAKCNVIGAKFFKKNFKKGGKVDRQKK